MASADWLRTFVAIYRSGSVSAGAARRGLSQPAASQQLAALERRIGLPLFTRTPAGVVPTRRGRDLQAQVADTLDRLEHVLAGIEGGVLRTRPSPLRLGSSAEFFSYAVVPRLGPSEPPLVARFGPDAELLGLLEQGDLDVAVTSASPGRRTLVSTPIGLKRFALVATPAEADGAPAELEALGPWLAGRAWVAYSTELPMTRRFWQASLGRPFDGDLRLVAPDLRAVVAAVEHGLGISLLPEFACADALTRGTVASVHPVAHVVPAEPWFACTRLADAARPDLARFAAGLSVPAGPPPGGLPANGPPVS
ncbi:MAG: LysR family transcriptional regulator [Acidimicrobiales bacterium]